jgi:uncharacterized membrane protein
MKRPITKEERRPENSFKKIGAEVILFGIGAGITFFTWVVMSIFSVQAKADRVIAVEEKVDYIYQYLIEKKK